jgi:hypothetical protein
VTEFAHRGAPAPTRVVAAPGGARVTAAAAALFAFFALVLLMGDAWRAPFQFGDDLLLTLGEFDGRAYASKLREEGRWLVLAWRMALPTLPASVDFLLALAFFCAAMALVAVRLAPDAPALVAAATLALAANPHAVSLLLWPRTVVAMTAVLFVAVILIDVAAGRRSPFALPAAAAAGAAAAMLTMQLFALVVIGAALGAAVARRADGPPGRMAAEGAAVIAAGAAGGAAGLAASLAVNWAVFGVFGYDIAAWRSRGEDIGTGRAAQALETIRSVAAWTAEQSGPWPFVLAALALGTLLVAAARRRSAGPLLMAVAAAGVIGAVAAIPLASGAPAPASRGGVAAWLGIAMAIVFAGTSVDRRPVAAAALVVLAAAGLWTAPGRIAELSRIGQANRAAMDRIDMDVRALDADEGVRRLVAVGEGVPLTRIEDQGPWWPWFVFRDRFEGRYGEQVVVCFSVEACDGHDPAALRAALDAAPAWPAQGYAARHGDLVVLDFGREP